MASRFSSKMSLNAVWTLAWMVGCGAGSSSSGSPAQSSGADVDSGAGSGPTATDSGGVSVDSAVSSGGALDGNLALPEASAGSLDGATPSNPVSDSASLPPLVDAADAGAIADTEAGSRCPGVPIVPDTGGFVAPGSNSVGIHGSWFVYSDCVDLKGVNCATVTTPVANKFPNVGGKMCTSGKTSSAPLAWGAGIGLELNDLPPQQPYDTTASGVKGFCFSVTGSTIPSTSIRVEFPTQNNNDNAYFAPVSSPGQHTVLFSGTAQGSWVTNKVPFEPTKVMLLRFAIPSSPTAPVPWDFCVEGLTAITQ